MTEFQNADWLRARRLISNSAESLNITIKLRQTPHATSDLVYVLLISN